MASTRAESGDTERRRSRRRGGRGRGRGRGPLAEAPIRALEDEPAERGMREDFGPRREPRFSAPREAEVIEQPEPSALRTQIEEERAEAGLHGGGDFERRSSRSRRGGRGRGRGGRGEREDGERRRESGSGRGRGDSRERAPREDEPRPAEPLERPRPVAVVRPPWQDAGVDGSARESEADRPGFGDVLDYSGRRIKKGRYSTGALFRPREKHERQQRGGRWEAPPRAAWGALDEEESPRPTPRAPEEPTARDGSNGNGERADRGDDAGERSGGE